jgi:Na+-driven multidrug efflux pump
MTLAGSLSAVFVNRALITYGGDLAVSTFGIINRIMMFALMPGMTVGQGLQPILGYNYGAKRYGRALKAIKIAIVFATIFGVLAFVVLYFAPEPFVGIFTTDSELIALGTYAAKRLFLAMYLVGFIMVGSTIFQAIGKVAESFVTSISRPALFLLPLIFILPHYWELDGVWLAYPITDALTCLLVLTLLVPQLREFRKKDMLTRGAVVGVRTG